MTEFTARNTRTQAIVADADGLVFESICEVVLAFGHGSDKNTDAFSFSEALDIVSYPNNFGVKAKRDFPTIRRQVIGYGILDDF